MNYKTTKDAKDCLRARSARKYFFVSFAPLW